APTFGLRADTHDIHDAPERAEDNAWLEQARRAAKAAGPADTYDYEEGKESKGGLRTPVMIGIVVLVVLVLGVIGYTFVRPFLAKKHDATPPAQAQVHPPGERPALSPPDTTQKPAGAQGQNAAPAGSPQSALAPRQDDLGQPAPNQATATPAPGATPPAPTA